MSRTSGVDLCFVREKVMHQRRITCMIMAFVLAISFLSGCRAEEKDISCADVVAAYEKAGYQVFHKDTATEDYDWECYVKAQPKDSDDYIFFYFFDSEDAAEEYANTRQWNAVLWLYSLVSFQPTWLTTKTYGNIEYEYDNSDLVKPFNDLIK